MNILLDSRLLRFICDFGLSRFGRKKHCYDSGLPDYLLGSTGIDIVTALWQ
jgi:hypothetical protein